MLGGECTSGSARVQAVPRQLHSARSHFKGKELKRANRSSVVARKQVVTENFKFMKNLGLKKPAFLPDFGLVRIAGGLAMLLSLSTAISHDISVVSKSEDVYCRTRERLCLTTSSQALTRAPCNRSWQIMLKSQEVERNSRWGRKVGDHPASDSTHELLTSDVMLCKIY